MTFYNNNYIELTNPVQLGNLLTSTLTLLLAPYDPESEH